MATDKLVDFDHVTDYISREECIKNLREYEKTAFSGLTVIGCMSRIKRIPAADVRPVVKGTWEIADSYAGPGLMNLRCSVCGGFGGTWKDNTLPSMLYKFCPNCGADMRPNLDATKGERRDESIG